MRCAHINRIGEQCRGQVVINSRFCAYHAGILEGRSSSALDEEDELPARRRSRFPLIYRIAAGLLLLMFLLEFAQNIRGWLNN
jgi:hypothetical protein